MINSFFWQTDRQTEGTQDPSPSNSLSPPLPPVWVLLLHSGFICLFCPSQLCSFPLHSSLCIIFFISSPDAPPRLSDLLSSEVRDGRWEVRPVTLPGSSLPFTFDRGNKQNRILLTFLSIQQPAHLTFLAIDSSFATSLLNRTNNWDCN